MCLQELDTLDWLLVTLLDTRRHIIMIASIIITVVKAVDTD
jgi:hypothetical protein